jgi:hypothetical protein
MEEMVRDIHRFASIPGVVYVYTQAMTATKQFTVSTMRSTYTITAPYPGQSTITLIAYKSIV